MDKEFITSASVFTLTNVMWLIITKIDIIMLSILSDSEDVALYGVANRIIFFDPSVPHCSTSCSDSKTRMNININYF